MYEEKTINRIIRKACAECERIVNIFSNGQRAEGYSFIVTGMLYSCVVNKLIELINKEYPEEKPLSAWRIQSGKWQLPCSDVKNGQNEDCVELRLMH